MTPKNLLLALSVSALIVSSLGCLRSEQRDSPGLYRRIQPVDLCMEREVFTAPSSESLAGRLQEESEIYRESPGAPAFAAISFSIWEHGRRIDIWRRKDLVMSWYVRKDKRYEQCSWIVSPHEVIFGPNDVHVSTKIQQTGPGSWEIGPRS